MKWIFGFLILVLMSSVAVSNHTPHRNRVSHAYDLETESNTYATATDRDPPDIVSSRSRTSSKHDEGNQRWTAVSDVKCKNASYRGSWGCNNYTPHEIENTNGSGNFRGIFSKNARVKGLRPNVTEDSREAIKRCGASSSISAWVGSPSSGNATFSASSIPW